MNNIASTYPSTYPSTSGASFGSLGGQSLAGLSAPGVEVGQVQMAIASLNNAIEQAGENQQAMEIRLNPVLLIQPQGKEVSTAEKPEIAVCEIAENIKRLQQKVDYLVSRQRHILQTVQL